MKEELEVLQDRHALFVERRNVLQLRHEAHEQLVVGADAHVGRVEFLMQFVDFAEIRGRGGGIDRRVLAGAGGCPGL